MLHLLGYDLTLQDLKDFRQLDSKYYLTYDGKSNYAHVELQAIPKPI